jgi:phage gpG-like protein
MARVQGRITIEVEVKADDVLDLLDKMDDRIGDMRPVFRWTKGYLETANAANFAANGLPTGQPWKPLDAQYGAWKARNYPGTGMLRQTGRLFRSLTSLSDSSANIISKDTATLAPPLNMRNSINTEQQKCRKDRLCLLRVSSRRSLA